MLNLSKEELKVLSDLLERNVCNTFQPFEMEEVIQMEEYKFNVQLFEKLQSEYWGRQVKVNNESIWGLLDTF